MKKFLSLVVALAAFTTLASAETLIRDCGDWVKITANPVEGYHFVQWNDGNTENPRTVEASNTTYTASFAINTYTIRFMNGTEVLKTCTVNHGETPVYGLADPTKESTAQYDYTFSGWYPNIYAANKDQDYNAQFEQTLRTYTIVFKDWDGTLLKTQNDVPYGTTPTPPADPSRSTVAGISYTFTGWRKEGASVNGIEEVHGAAVYIAQYSTTAENYTISVAIDTECTGMGTVSGGGTGHYNDKVTISANANACYRFVRWNDGNTTQTNREVTITGDATIYAIFEKIQYTVEVVSSDTSKGTVSIEATTAP